jgi:hypothetical protein
MPRKSHSYPNIRVDGDYIRGTRWVWRQFSSHADEVAAAKYEQDVIDLIEKTFTQRGTSLRLLWEIKMRSPRSVCISPYTKADAANPHLGPHNAYAAPTNPKDAAPQGGAPYVGGSDDPKTARDDRYDLASYQGTSKGSSSYVHFTAANHSAAYGPGMAPDEVLLHELVHSLRDMEGHANPVPTTGTNLDYENIEEFLAVLVTNVYASERDGPLAKLRFSHGNATLPASQQTSAGFLAEANNLRLVRTLASQEADLFSSLANVRMAPFNPIAEYWNNRNTTYK